MRLIDADGVWFVSYTTPKGVDERSYSKGVEDGIHMVKKQIEPVDAVPVVRCKDCVFWGWHKRAVNCWSGEEVKRCGIYKYPIEKRASDFCSCGKKDI